MSGFHVGAEFLRELGEERSFRAARRCWTASPTASSGRRSRPGRPCGPISCSSQRIPIKAGSRSSIPCRVLSALVEVAGIFKEQRRGMPQLSRSHREHAEHARLILDNQLADPPAVSELARIVGLNEDQPASGLQGAAFGSTIIDYLRDRRLEVARVLVRERRLSIAEIGYRVGFSSPANFATAYRRRFGLAPSQDL